MDVWDHMSGVGGQKKGGGAYGGGRGGAGGGEQQDKHFWVIDLLEGAVVETDEGLIRWEVSVSHTEKLFVLIHQFKPTTSERILDIQD